MAENRTNHSYFLWREAGVSSVGKLHTIKVAMQTIPQSKVWQGVEMCAGYPLVCFRLLSSSLRAPGASQLSRDSRVSSGRGRPGALDK